MAFPIGILKTFFLFLENDTKQDKSVNNQEGKSDD